MVRRKLAQVLQAVDLHVVLHRVPRAEDTPPVVASGQVVALADGRFDVLDERCAVGMDFHDPPWGPYLMS